MTGLEALPAGVVHGFLAPRDKGDDAELGVAARDTPGDHLEHDSGARA